MTKPHDARDRARVLQRVRTKLDEGRTPTAGEIEYILELAELSEGLREDSLAAHAALTAAGVGAPAARLDLRVRLLLRAAPGAGEGPK